MLNLVLCAFVVRFGFDYGKIIINPYIKKLANITLGVKVFFLLCYIRYIFMNYCPEDRFYKLINVGKKQGFSCCLVRGVCFNCIEKYLIL